jgi:hypothetical protein
MVVRLSNLRTGRALLPMVLIYVRGLVNARA